MDLAMNLVIPSGLFPGLASNLAALILSGFFVALREL